MNVCFGQGHAGLGNQLGDGTISHKLPLRHQRPLITLPGRSFFPVPCLLSISPNRNPLLCFISPPPQALPKPRTPLPIHTDLQAPICHPPTSCSLLPPASFFWSPHGAITFLGWYKGQMFAPPSKVLGGTCTHTTSHLPWGHCLGIITLGSLPWGRYLGVITLGSLPWVQTNGQRWQGVGILSPSLRPLHCPRTKISTLSTWGRSPGSALPT